MRVVGTTGRGSAQAQEALAALERRGGAALDAVLPAVKKIVGDVRRGGDRALLRYAAKFDGLVDASALRVTKEEMQAAWEAAKPEMQDALRTASEQIRGFAVEQLPASWLAEDVPGLMTGQMVRPLGAVGCYVPSGRHPLPSTLLMTAIPAQVAGVERIVAVSPKPARETLAAALEMDDASERAIDVQVTRLRRKIEPDPREPRFLHTVRGKGYVLKPGS